MGQWLAEPIFENDSPSLCFMEEKEQSITMALMHLMDSLKPVERAVFVLHDIFAYSFKEIAEILDKSEGNCRKLASRARQHIRQKRPQQMANHAQHKQLLEGFVAAARNNDVQGLLKILKEDVQLVADGGGKAQTIPRLMTGYKSVAHFFAHIFATINAIMSD